jgi:aryl-alcohol dehydrogenase-like predicted oxidoreductase
VTLIDTAPVYGFGRSEEIVGKALEGSLRHKVTIATKVGLAWKDGAVYRDSRPARIRKEIEDFIRSPALKRSREPSTRRRLPVRQR